MLLNDYKFVAIMQKVSELVELEGTARLTFEVSDGIHPALLHQTSKMGKCRSLMPDMSDRWLVERNAL